MSCTLRQQPAGAPNCKMVCFPTSSSRPAISTTSPLTSPPGKSAAKGAGSTFAAFRPSGTETLTKVTEIATSYGRIRTVQQGPDGALYFTTSNGAGKDGLYRLTA